MGGGGDEEQLSKKDSSRLQEVKDVSHRSVQPHPYLTRRCNINTYHLTR